MAGAAEVLPKHEHILEELKTEALIAILTDDVEHFDSVLKTAILKGCAECGVERLLRGFHTFKPVGKEYNQAFLRVLRDLLVNQHVIESDDLKNTDELLDMYLEKYRGQLSHIAACLGRKEIIAAMALAFTTYKELILFDSHDCTGKTPLMLAIERYHADTTLEITKMLNEPIAPCITKHAIQVIQGIVSQYTYRICYDPKLMPALETFLSETERFYDSYKQNISVMWHIFNKNFKGLSQVSNWDCVSCKYGTESKLHPLHYAVRLYSKEALTDKEIKILEFLINKCSECSSVNYINRWRMPKECDHEEIDGTAVHFALSTYHPRRMWPQIHPGFDDQGHLRVSYATSLFVEGPDNPHVQMLQFLRKRGANLWKSNHYNKRPLDCLPSDADPHLFNLLFDSHQQENKKRKRSE